MWKKLGDTINIEGTTNEAVGNYIHKPLSLTGNGLIVAIGDQFFDANGDYSNGRARVYKYNGTYWSQRGDDIIGPSGSRSGWSVCLSEDGERLAVGMPSDPALNLNLDPGSVRVYRWNRQMGGSWIQMGSDIIGEAPGDAFGQSVSLSNSGDRLAVSADQNDGNGADSGSVRVYEWQGSEWIQLGGDIEGEAAADGSGISVSLSGNGVSWDCREYGRWYR